MGDKAAIPEREMIRQMWNGSEQVPATDDPEISVSNGGLKISCKTKGASIGYRLIKKGTQPQQEMNEIVSWDFTAVFNAIKNGNKKPAAAVWKVYDGEQIQLGQGDTLRINVQRIGYKPAVADWVNGNLIKRN